ncbi:MAG: hypothetical protein HDR12_09900 [Lachnospiraceae bacterium]|nr:hypothetical protein [Lachnospiraceae bacterium]
MAEYDFETIKTLLLKSIDNGWEAELTLYMNSREYMIIIYEDHCSFQKCGYKDGSGEYYFASLDELYVAEQVDGIILKRDWEKIEHLDCVDFEMQGFWR